ncbi:Hsp20/alpha crystallin family protein [Hymenobacter sp. B81]|uniref:Hsp20/alpha crystallin family protein n=1 Tax=Hymenobacter sp. B81 TaxID=3344878 RepID=UPI0037DD0044
MAIQRYAADSFGDSLPQSFSAMLDRFFNDSLAQRGRVSAFSPQVDAYETERSYEIEAALPGLKREDIKVEFHQGRLTISGERRLEQERNDRRYHVLESQYGSFQRSFQLPDVANAQGIEASFEDGVLHVTVPKDEQKTMRHQIQVRGNRGGNGGQLSERMGEQATEVRVAQGSSPQANASSSANAGSAAEAGFASYGDGLSDEATSRRGRVTS